MNVSMAKKMFCFSVSLMGLVLIGLGIYLLATSFALAYITIGTIVSGVLMLFFAFLPRCFKFPVLICLLLTIVTLFMLITGILAILAAETVIGLILIGLSVLTLLLNATCLIISLLGSAGNP